MALPRVSEHPIDPVFLARWSPRAFDRQPIRINDLMTLLEAARWAPSAFNIQPWRFLYAIRGDAHWDLFLGQQDVFNQGWSQNASALILVLSDTIMPGDGERPDQPSRYHSFDAGAAWGYLALQATRLGYHAHAMAGMDSERTQKALNIPERYQVEIAIAVGRKAEPEQLPQALQSREIPSQRHPLSDIAFPGPFPD